MGFWQHFLILCFWPFLHVIPPFSFKTSKSKIGFPVRRQRFPRNRQFWTWNGVYVVVYFTNKIGRSKKQVSDNTHVTYLPVTVYRVYRPVTYLSVSDNTHVTYLPVTLYRVYRPVNYLSRVFRLVNFMKGRETIQLSVKMHWTVNSCVRVYRPVYFLSRCRRPWTLRQGVQVIFMPGCTNQSTFCQGVVSELVRWCFEPSQPLVKV